MCFIVIYRCHLLAEPYADMLAAFVFGREFATHSFELSDVVSADRRTAFGDNLLKLRLSDMT